MLNNFGIGVIYAFQPSTTTITFKVSYKQFFIQAVLSQITVAQPVPPAPAQQSGFRL